MAYHLRQAGDERATDWLLRAGYRAERAYAWDIAAERCAAALALLERRGASAGERGWLAYRLAALGRYRDPRGALATLAEAERLADDAGDQALAACALFLRGNLHCYAGEFGPGLAALGAGTAAIDALAGEEWGRLRALGSIGGFVPGARHHRGTLALRLAGAGHFTEARRVAGGLLDGSPTAREEAPANLAVANAARALAIAEAAQGRPDAARQGFARARTAFQRLGDHFHVGVTAAQELQWVALPYRADHPEELEGLAAEAQRAWSSAGDALADLPLGFARLPVLLLTGEWAAADDLALAVYAAGGSFRAQAARVLGQLAAARGDRALVARLVREELPGGAETPPGAANNSTALVLQRAAATLALAAGDLAEAREWLAAHDRWFVWSGAVLGQAEGHLAWAAYHRAGGATASARRHAGYALSQAAEPRQPLALLAAHRLVGELAIAGRRPGEATTHLGQSLKLAEACEAPYERALTFLALAELRRLVGDSSTASTLAAEARVVFDRLGSASALARADALAAPMQLAAKQRQAYPGGLSEREVEVLRRVAAGGSNREIGAALALSVRTVEKHIAHIYNKLGTRGRGDAVAYAARHGILSEADRRS